MNEKSKREEISQDIEKVTDYLLKTDQKAERTTRINEALQIFNDALNSSISAVILVDLEGKITYVNDAYLRLFGIEDDEVVLGEDIDVIFAGENRLGQLSESFSDYKKGVSDEVDLKRLDGSIFTAILTYSPVSDSEGQIVGRMFSFQDISARKQVEKEKEILNNELEQKNRELEQIVYVASHDLRSPLVNVQGFSRELERSIKELNTLFASLDLPETARREISFLLQEDIDESLGFILSSVSKMDKLLAGLLRLSRLGRAAMHMERLDMNRLVRAIINAMEYQIKEVTAQVVIEDLPACIGDETQIGQVFTNLVDNAVKYRDASRRLQIRIRGECLNDECVYIVEDNGRGIDPGHQEKIFEIFHRLTPTEGTGEGLGLTIVRRVLDKHRGKVSVESSPGVGSRFYVHLPNRPQEEESVQ